MLTLGRLFFILVLFAITPVTAAYAAADTKLEAAGHEAINETIEEGVASQDGSHGEGHGEPAHGAADGHEKQAGLPQFDPSSFVGQIFWLVIAFTILYTVFARKTLPDISSTLESRHQHIQSDLDTAESLRSDAEEVHQAYEKALHKARNDAAVFYMEADRDAKAKTAAALHGFHERAMQNVSETEKRIEQAKAAAMEDMSSIAADIARQAAEKIVGEPTDLAQAKTVVQSIHKRKAA